MRVGLNPRAWRAWAGVAMTASLLAACSSTPKPPDPTPLVQPAPSVVRAQVAWTASVGDVRPGVRPAVAAGTLAVAAEDGTVTVLETETGRVQWRASVGEALGAGAWQDGRHVAVVTRGGEVVVLREGQELWRRRLSARSLTAPLVAGERVFVYAQDRSVHAFDAETGARLWVQQRPGDPLTLSQQGVLLPVGDTLLVGQGPRLAALDPLRGTVRWEVPVASPRGTNEVERLADLVGPAGRQSDTVCVRAFQASVGCVDTRRARLLWNKASNGATGLGVDADQAYGVDSTGRITAYRLSDGDAAWTTDGLRFRGLTAPLAAGDSLVVGDQEGYVHFLSRRDGALVGRVATDGSGIAGAPLQVGAQLVVLTRAGRVYAFRPE
jgi:outer membrane protein assembly factor BamB